MGSAYTKIITHVYATFHEHERFRSMNKVKRN